MFNRVEGKYRAVKEALTTKRELKNESRLSYEDLRLIFEVFLLGGHRFDMKKYIWFGKEEYVHWGRGVELEYEGKTFELVVYTDPKEADGYGALAGNCEQAILNLSLRRKGGPNEVVKLYPEGWFMEKDQLYLNQAAKIVEDTAEVARKIANREYTEPHPAK